MSSSRDDTLEKVKGKGKRGLVRIVFGRTLFFIVCIIAQVFVLWAIYRWLDERYQIYGYSLSLVVGAILAVYIINDKSNPSFKLAWIVPVLLFPVFGGFMYVFVHLQQGNRRMGRRVTEVRKATAHYLTQDREVILEMEEKSLPCDGIAKYLWEVCGFPAYANSEATYFPLGDYWYEAVIDEISRAEYFIFMEYFIIDHGVFWDGVLDILKEKAAQGVEVRVMYDGTNTVTCLPPDYPKELESFGIKCRVFNPIRPAMSTVQNNRDHRKILVIDGKTAFTGGVNIADEYVNKRVRYGHWKDNAVMLKGDAVRSFTVMFLQMWDAVDRHPVRDKIYDYDKWLETKDIFKAPPHSGYFIPYSDSPLDNEPIGHQVYLDIIYQAKSYVYIMTPYLILDQDMITALTFAAKRGVDVRIMMPHKPDKIYVFLLAHTYYPELIEAGVKIYEYIPGFVHAKTFVSDDIQGVVGSINLDFRSQYLHFEDAVYICDSPILADIKLDFERTLDKCEQMTMEKCRKFPVYERIAGSALRLIAPLM